jgi:predicted RNA-binding Zn-ribbon protein involved in translation (DUF1610 family)
MERYIVVVPLVMLFLMAGAAFLTARWVYNDRLSTYIERTRDADRCVSCGYDLIGNTSGVCPECGELTKCTEQTIGKGTRPSG